MDPYDIAGVAMAYTASGGGFREIWGIGNAQQ
jgi:hypothetical protein